MKLDLLSQDIKGTWQEVKSVQDIALLYDNIVFDNAYCWFNCQRFDAAKIPVYNFDKFVLSFHTEFFEHEMLIEFFNNHPNKQFLLISDWNYYDDIFPGNVQTVTWISLHEQAQKILECHGFCTKKFPTKRLSSLSYRHEFHKACVTSYMLSNTDNDDRILSWWNIKNQAPYYLEQGYYIHPKIAQYVLDESFQHHPPISLDVFDNSPLANTQWRHPAYIDCVFNLSNESVFNSRCRLGRLPGPYITDKTWKVLFSGTGLVPVGQVNTLQHLISLGLEFDYQIDLSYDLIIEEDDRMLGIFNTIDSIISTPLDKLHRAMHNSAYHNIDHIVNGDFSKFCRSINDSKRHIIEEWIKM